VNAVALEVSGATYGGVESIIRIVYLLAAVGFVLGLHFMRSPATARRGNTLSWIGMAFAVAASVFHLTSGDGSSLSTTAIAWIAIGVGALVGAAGGLFSARLIQMTDMPQLVSVINAVGGGAAALVAVVDFLKVYPGLQANPGAATALQFTIPVGLDILIGSVTFSGSLIAAGKLQGWVSGNPILFPGARILSALSAAAGIGGVVWLAMAPGMLPLYVVAAGALAFGVLLVLPIGGADMPVVVSLLNAFTGLAVAMAGFVVGNPILIIAGALVGASGSILTKLMADAMNRSILAIMVGGFGTTDSGGGAIAAGGGTTRLVSGDDVAVMLAYAQKVIIVPGYGLAAAQAQREAGDLGKLLEEHGITVLYAIHPVAGRMPGHMNVLLAEADVPYEMLKEMDEVNGDFDTCDVALVIGANDVTNPAARRSGNPISGMPILNVDHSKSIVVIKRSLGFGYAGLDNELYTNPKTGMFLADAKKGLTQLITSVKEYL
jgi:NAD(P) transhydrogenase subunit beta